MNLTERNKKEKQIFTSFGGFTKKRKTTCLQLRFAISQDMKKLEAKKKLLHKNTHIWAYCHIINFSTLVSGMGISDICFFFYVSAKLIIFCSSGNTCCLSQHHVGPCWSAGPELCVCGCFVSVFHYCYYEFFYYYYYRF